MSFKMKHNFALWLFVLSFSIVLETTISNAAFIPQKRMQQSIFSNSMESSHVIRGKNNMHFLTSDGVNNNNNDSDDDDSKKEEERSRNGDPSSLLPSDHHESAARRRERMVRMHEEMQRFVHGSELQNLRSDIAVLKESLQVALATDNIGRIIDLSNAIETAQEKDPEFVYSRLLNKIDHIQQSMSFRKRNKLLPKIIEEAVAVRKYIPRLNMEGLWIGK